MGKFRAFIITDIHCGRDIGNRFGTAAPRLLRKFFNEVSKHNPDVIIDLGDRVSTYCHPQDTKHMKEIAAYFTGLATPRIHLLGNHDVCFLTPDENAEIMKTRMESHSREIAGFQFVIWNPVLRFDKGRTLQIAQTDLDWVKQELTKSNKPVIFLTHMPVNHTATPDQEKRNKWGLLYYKRYDNGHELRQILQDSGRNFLVMAGDYHENQLKEIDGAFHITLNSLTQRATGTRKPSGTYALLEIDGDKISFEVFGEEPLKHSLTSKVLKP